MLIDDRPGAPSADERQPIEPNWRVCAWVAVAAVLGFAAAHAAGFVAYLLVCATVYAACRAVALGLDYMCGLTEWRQ
jgi:hypothetical protein